MINFFKYLILALPASAILSGCINAKQTELSSVPDCFTGNFSSQIHIISGENEYMANVSKISENKWSAEFSEPASLSGAELTFEDGMVSASYKGLAFSIPKDALPVQSAMQNLILVSEKLNTLYKTDNEDNSDEIPEIICTSESGSYHITGNIDNGEFELITDEEGVPLSFVMENFALTIEFSEFSKNSSDIENNSDMESLNISETENTAEITSAETQ